MRRIVAYTPGPLCASGASSARWGVDRPGVGVRRRTAYKVHRWIAITVGGFILVWLISGMVMVLPSSSSGVARPRAETAPDFRAMNVSPAEAVAALTKALGEPPQVRSMSLKRIVDVMGYEVTVQDGGSYLIDARSGRLFTITAQMGERIARRYVPPEAGVLESALVSGHSLAYPWGPLPTYRFVFDHDRSTAFYVATRDGAIRITDRWSWIKDVMGALHTFQPFKLITRQDVIRKGMLVLLSGIGIGVVATGYYLALPRRSEHRLGVFRVRRKSAE